MKTAKQVRNELNKSNRYEKAMVHRDGTITAFDIKADCRVLIGYMGDRDTMRNIFGEE